MISLLQFAKEQIQFIEKYAEQLRKLELLQPEFMPERHIKQLKESATILNGVSVREIMREVMFPGSFRHSMGF